MSILIISEQGDIHAHAARWALDLMGHRCHRWWPEALAAEAATLRFSDDHAGAELSGRDGPFDASAIRTVWLRRFGSPPIPESFAPGDRTVARRELDGFLRGVGCALPPSATWLNPPDAQRTARLKAPQLAAARRVGLRIPRTVMTNDAEVVRAFLRATGGPVIYKPFHPAVWHVDQECRFWVATSLVGEDDLADAEALRLSPGIFQEFVAKRYELRISIFGRTCIAARISGQDPVDWRVTYRMQLEPYTLPAEIEARLVALMDELGLAMGMIDMIVDEAGNYVFLEVNEQGQFLWLEELNPDILVFDPFVHFLAAADRGFRWDGAAPPRFRFGDYLRSPAAAEFHRRELEESPLPPRPILVPEAVA